MSLHVVQATIGAVGAGAASVIGVALKLAYNKFRKTGAVEIESFGRYASQGAKYYIGKFIRRQLAAQLTLRQYARLQLHTTAREMLVPATFPVRLNVDRTFVPLLLAGPTKAQLSFMDLLEKSGERIMILGEPGSGKSSWIKRQ